MCNFSLCIQWLVGTIRFH